MKKFLKKLKVGDKVAYESNSTKGFATIDRITKTMILLSNGNRYNKETGKIVRSGSWLSNYLVEMTPEWYQKFTRGKLEHSIDNLFREGVVAKLSDKDLNKLYSILKQGIK